MFRETRVTSCSRVLIKNGNAVCVPFKTNLPKPAGQDLNKSVEIISMAQ
jgi:hypothetical protein